MVAEVDERDREEEIEVVVVVVKGWDEMKWDHKGELTAAD